MKTVGLTELARHFDKSIPAIRNWIAKGMPVAIYADRSKGIPWEFDVIDCEDWREEYDQKRQEALDAKQANEDAGEHADIIAARKRKIEVETERLLLRLDQERGELVPVDVITTIVERQYSNVKAHLLSLPDKVSPTLINRSDAKEINDIIKSYIYEALEELQQEQLWQDDTELGMIEDESDNS